MLGEHSFSAPSVRSMGALLYLALFGSVIAFSAYGYLLSTVRPALATSYAYVNPPVALLLGAGLAHERVTASMVAAMALILSGVAVLAFNRSPSVPVALQTR